MFVCRKKEPHSYSHFLTVLQSWQEKVLKSEHPTEFGKISKKENTAVIFKEERMNQILQSNNKSKANWKQNNDFWSISGSFIYRHHVQETIFFFGKCSRKARHLSH